jgi:hypothetical protein
MPGRTGSAEQAAPDGRRPLAWRVERRTVPVLRIAALLLAGSIVAATANEMRNPRMSGVNADWTAAAAQVAMPAAALPEPPLETPPDPGPSENAGTGNEPAKASGTVAPGTTEAASPPPAPPPAPAPRIMLAVPTDPVARVNDASARLIPSIAASPIPVLLPLDTAALQRDRASDSLRPLGDYLGGFKNMGFFQAGPGGYDALFGVYVTDLPELGVKFSERIDVQISGSALLYELDEPKGMINWPVNGLAADFPGIRRLYLESIVRYTFVRYGVPYVVSILCNDGRSGQRKVSCRDADKVAAHALRALRVAGGTPPPRPDPTAEVPWIEAGTIDRPAAASEVFTYYGPGDLIPGTGSKGQSGRVDYTVYSKIRFPIAEAPAFANSQSFMNWGDCDQTGRVMLGRRGTTPAYRCRVNDQMLIADEAAADNYAYPWRDNFCEHRYFSVGECPAGLGHQGQDIRPAACARRGPGADRCEPYQHDVVAARDGIVIRSPEQMAFYVVTNTANERVRYRYLHMSPKQLDENGILNGRVVREGEVIGKVGNYFKRERGTTYHLHFDMQVPTRYGWVFVNPYMTLVAAYERQIGAQGRELKRIKDIEEVKAPPLAAEPPAPKEAEAAKAMEPVKAADPTKGTAPVKLPEAVKAAHAIETETTAKTEAKVGVSTGDAAATTETAPAGDHPDNTAGAAGSATASHAADVLIPAAPPLP